MKTTLLPGTIRFNTSTTDHNQQVRNFACKVAINQHPTASSRNRTKWDYVSLVLLITLGLFLAGTSHTFGQSPYTSMASGNWNDDNTWSGTGIPVAGDVVSLANGHTITVTANAACASITFPTNNVNHVTLNINSGITLTVSGAITIPQGNEGVNTVAVGAGILNAGSIAFTNGGFEQRHVLTISTGTVTVSGNVTQSSSTGSATITFTGAGLLKLGGAFLTSGTCTFTASSGTVEYNGAAQTVQNFAYSNLTISGSGTKTLAGNSDVGGTLTVKAETTLELSNNTLGATTDPTGVVLECGATTGSIISGTGALYLGGNVTVNSVATGTRFSNPAPELFEGNVTVNSVATGTSGATISCPVNLVATRTFTVADDGSSATDLTVSGVISGNTLGVTKAGAGTMLLSGANTYTGLTTINAGTLKLGAAGDGLNTPLGTVAAETLVNSGAELDLNGFTLGTSEPLTLNGNGISGGGALNNSSGSIVNYNGALTLASASSIGTPSGRITLGGEISGGMDLIKVGTGTLNIGSLTATLNSLTIGTSGGTLIAGSATVNIAGNFTNNGSFTASTSTVNFNGAIQTIGGTNSTTFNNLTFSGSGTKTLSVSITINGNLSIISPVIANLGTGSHNANALSLGGNNQPSGTYGGTSSAAQYKIPVYFADVTGILNVATGSCTPGYWLGNISTDWNTASNWCNGNVPASSTDVTILSGTPFQPVISSSALCNNIIINPSATLTMSGTGTLTVSGTWTNSGTFTAGTGTVIFNGAAQTITGVTTFNNVTLTGTGSKTITTANFIVNGILSMEGPVAATLSLAPTYGAAATLLYNTVIARPADVEWLPSFVATGGVIINTGTITLNNATTLGNNSNVPLNIKTGATLITSNFDLTFHGDFINDGTLNAGSSSITITGTVDGQNIDGFTTTGTVSMTKTGGTATLLGNVNGTGLTISGTGGTLNLGTSLTHVFTGDWTRTNGTLNGGSSLLKIGGSFSETGGTFTAVTGTVEWNATGNQTLAGVTYNNLILSGSGIKTTTSVTVNGILSMEGSATASVLPAYGSSATLQYKGSLAQTTGLEFPSTWAGTGGVKIENANGVTLLEPKNIGTTSLTIGASVPNSIFNDNGNQLTSTGTFNLTSGKFKLGGTSATSFPAFATINILDGTTVEYAATAAQTIKGIAYSNLTISGSGNNSKRADGNIAVNGILNLNSENFSSTQGCLDMNTTPFILTMGANATTTGTGDVTGIVTRNSFAADTYYTFGNQFTTLNMQTGGTLPSSVSFKIVLTASHPWKTNAINRYYDIAQTGGTSGTKATLNLHYLLGELNSATENNLDLFDFLVSSSTLTDDFRSNSSSADKWVGLANLAIDYIAPSTGFGSKYWTLGTSTAPNFTWVGSISTDWTNGANWTGENAPGSGNAVFIPDAAVTINDPTLPGSTTIGSITIQSGGILNATTGTPVLTISGEAGAWTNLGTLNAGSGTVVFTSPSATMSGITNFYNVTVNIGAALILGTDNIMRVGATLSLSTTGILNASSNHNIVEYNGTDQTVINPGGSTSGYHNLILSGSGIKTMPSSAMTMTGDFIMSGTSSATAGNVLTVTDNVILGSGTTFDPSTFTHIISGNWTNNGATFSPTTGTITFNNTSSSQVINGTAASQTFFNLTVNKVSQTLSVEGGISLTVNDFTETSGNFSAPGTFTVNGNATLTSGTFTGGATATITGNAILSGGTFIAGTTTNVLGDWTKNSTVFTAGSGTVNFNGSTAQTIGGTTSTIFNNLGLAGSGAKTLSAGTQVNGNLTMSGTATTTIAADLTIGGNLVIGAGNIFTVPATRTLIVSSNITNAGNSGLVIKSDVSGDGKLINNTSSVPATVELYLTGGLVSPGVGRFHYFVPPVQSMSIGITPTVEETKTALGLTYFNGDLIRYLEPQAINTKEQGWQYFHNYPGTPPGFTSLVSSIGYNIYLNGSSDVIKFKGDLNAGPHTFNLSYTPGNVGAGWNLVGNPYPCNYDLTGIGGLGTVVDGISNTVYFNNNGGYGYWNVLTSTGSTGNTNILPPMTGFFVKVSQASLSLSLPVGSKTAGISDPRSAHKGGSLISEKGLAVQKVKLVLTTGSKSDETVALLFDDATTTFNEHYDAYKLFNAKSNSPDIYFELNGIDYFMKAVKAPASEAVRIPIKVVLREPGTHTINITEFENLDGIKVTLKHGAVEIELSQNASYSFTSEAGTFTDFELIFGEVNAATAVEEVTNENLRIWHSNDYLYVNFTGEIPSNTGRLIIYDFNGREVINNTNVSLVPKQTNQIPVNLQKGFYIADIVINSKHYKSKIVVY